MSVIHKLVECALSSVSIPWEDLRVSAILGSNWMLTDSLAQVSVK